MSAIARRAPFFLRHAIPAALLLAGLFAAVPARAEDPPPDCDPLFGECSGGSTGGQGTYNRLTSYVSGKVINDVWPNRIELTFDTASGAFFSWPSAANFAVRKPGTPNTAASDYRIASISAAYPVFTLTLADYDPADPSTHIANVDATTLTLAITSGQICGVANFECYPNGSYGQTPEAISAAQSDTSAPTLAAADIVVDNRSSPHRVTVTFSEPMAASAAADKTQWTLKSNDGALTYQIAAVAFTNGYKSVVLSLPAADVADPTTYLTNAAVQAHLKVTPPTTADPAGNAYAGGTVTEAGASHQLDATAPALNTAAIDAGNTTLTLTFSKTLLNALADTAALKSAIRYAADGSNFAALAADDSVALNGSALSVSFATPLTGSTGKLEIAANSLKDFAGNLQDSAVTTGAITTHDIAAPSYQGAALNAELNVVTLTFDETLVNALADLAALKAAIALAADGSNFSALVADDSVALDGSTLTITLATPLSGASNKIRIAADSLKDASGNRVGSLTTAALDARDTTPAAFAFNAVTGAALNSAVESATITVSGINMASPIAVTGGSYSINGAAYTSASGTVSNGDTVKVSHTSSASYATKTDTMLTIGGVSDTFSSTTVAAPPVNGACGSDHGQTLASAPSQLCATGTPGMVTGSGPWNWSCTGSNGGSDANCTAALYVAPATPTPEPQPAPSPGAASGTPGTITVTSSGSVTATPGGTVVIPSGTASSGASISLPAPAAAGAPAAPVTLAINGQTLTLTPSAPNTVVSVQTVTVNGQPTQVLIVTAGSLTATATAPGQPLLAVGSGSNAVVITADVAGTVASTALDVGTGMTLITIRSGVVTLPADTFVDIGTRGTRRAASRRLYAGETAVANANGRIVAVHVGSADGSAHAVGDPLSLPTVAGLTVLKTVPKLNGTVNRSGENLQAALGVQLRSLNLSQQGDTDAFGGFRLSDDQGTVFSVAPIGTVAVDPSGIRPDGITASGNGEFALTRNNLTITLVPSVPDLPALAAFVLSLGGSTTLQADGSLLISHDGQQIALQPSYLLGQGGPAGASQDADGHITWTDNQGRQQTLYPVTADFATLKAEVLKLDPAATLRGNANGTVSLSLGGQHFTLVPDYVLSAIPMAHFSQAWWIGEDGKLYVRYLALGKAQGFSVR